jgi:hypothetical protein
MSKKDKFFLKVLFVVSCAVLIYIPFAQAEKVVEGKTFYTTANIWYEHPDKIFSTNYHTGAIIPIGTKVTIKEVRDKEIQFISEKEQTFKIIFLKKHSKPGMTVWDYFEQYFSEENPLREGGAFHKFSEDEKRNIKVGEIAMSMSRAAVLMAYGYPPSHRTPSLKSDVWIYWTSRFEQTTVHFKDDKVTKIGY